MPASEPTRSVTGGSEPNGTARPASVTAIVVPIVVTVVVIAIVGFLIAPTRFDLPVVVALNHLHHGVLGKLTTAVYRVVSPVPAIVITALVAVVVVIATRRIRPALVLVVTVAVTWLPSAVVKILVGRERPTVSALAHPLHPHPHDASFPSGHEVFITAIVVALVFLVRPGVGRVVAGVVGALVIIGVGFCLMIDGVHYPSDVLASIVWSLGIAPCVRAGWLRWADPRVAPLDRILSRGSRTA